MLIAGAASFAAHASAHPLARALDGILALVAVTLVALTLIAMRPGWRQIAPALAIAAAGLTIWAVSRTGAMLCDGLGAAGHATWHILIAVAVVGMLRAGSHKAVNRPR